MRPCFSLATFLAMTSICAVGGASEMDLACARLTPDQADELRARVKLLLRGVEAPPRSVLVACDAERAWVVWNGPPAELLDAAASGELVEALLDAIEKRAHSAPETQSPATPVRARPAPTSPHETPTWERQAAAPTPADRPFVESGGMGVGLGAELLRAPLAPAIGPRLDVGLGWGPWSLQLTESARFSRTDAGASTLFYDLGAGVGWGAPFSRRHPVGAALVVGNEWFNVRGHTVSTGFASLGARGAIPVGPLSIALGVDVRARAVPEYVGERVDVQVPRWSGLLFLEGLLLVEPPQRPRPGDR